MKTDPNVFLPPVPRDHDTPSFSEIIPFRSKKISIRRSKVLLPLLIVALAVVALFSVGNHMNYINILCYLSLSTIFLGIYAYSGASKGWYWYLVPGLITYVLVSYEFWIYVRVFRQMLPGDTENMDNISGFWLSFETYFFGAGLCEEFLKATPILLALVAGYVVNRRWPSPAAGAQGQGWLACILRNLTLRGPLDGLLMGYAAGAAFIVDETLGYYVPHYMELAYHRSNNVAEAIVTGLELVIPRALGGVTGHMAYAGIFGYFIGLSARYPRRALTLIPLGYLLAAVLHTFWDTIDVLPYPAVWYALESVVIVLIFVACLLKAKQLELASHRVEASGSSILVGSPSPAADGAWAGLRKLANGLGMGAGAPTRSEAGPAPRFSIGVGTERYALAPGSAIDFGALFRDRGAPADASGEIDPDATEPDILGLKNIGSTPWMSITPKGAAVTIARGRTLRIERDTRIAFGALVLDIQTY